MSAQNAGDLVPKDITDILARESKSTKNKKHRGGSLSRAFSWLKGKKKKKGSSSVQSRGGKGGEGRNKTLHHGDPATAKALSKPEDDNKLTVHFTASEHFQENVFIEGSRPQYLEALHTEAQEGLKCLQQEENGNGLEHGDNQSIHSTITLQPEHEAGFRGRKGSLESESTTADTVSTVSARSALLRTGSTFKPYNQPKKPEKTKKRSRRTTIMGIPQHVQKELGIERATMIKHNADGTNSVRLANGGDGSVVIPTVDGELPRPNHEGARVHLQAIEFMQSSHEEKLLKHHIKAVYKDDFALHHKVGPRFSPMQRPKSLAVPGMTTHNYINEPQSPVMSMSPQATYLSKIIPNAILPASVDVIEISRSRSRNSVRTVSKSSLVSASPASTRSSMRSSARNFNISDLSSNSSNWSHSQSSETIVSNSSTISSKGSAKKVQTLNGAGEPAPRKTDKETNRPGPDQMSVNSSVSWASASSAMAQNGSGHGSKQKGSPTSPSSSTESGADSYDTASIQSASSFNRSMSVMKMKRPPAPPRRTYSLHQDKLKRRSRELQDSGSAETRQDNVKVPHQETWVVGGGKRSMIVDEVFSPGTPGSTQSGSPAYSADYSSPDDSRSSAAASPLTPETMAAREAVLKEQPGSSDSSPQKPPFLVNKFERTMSPSSGYSSQSGTPTLPTKEIPVFPSSPGNNKTKPAKPERTVSRTSPNASVSSSVTSLSSAPSEPLSREASANSQPAGKSFPPVAAVSNKAAPAPPTVLLREAFNIPPPPKVKAPSPPPPETWMNKKRIFEVLYGQNATANRFSAEKRGTLLMQKNETQTAEKQQSPLTDKIEILSVEKGSPLQSKETVQKAEILLPSTKEVPAVQKQESPVVAKKEPPPVMKKSSPLVHKKEDGPVQESPQVKNQISVEEKKPSPRVEKKTIPLAQNPTAIVIVQARTSPPPSPPPAHLPPPPPAKKTSDSSVSSPPPEASQVNPIAESAWPPPPPPLEESGPVFAVQDEVDFSFPLPPPPMSQETVTEVVSSPAVSEILENSGASTTPMAPVTVILQHEQAMPSIATVAVMAASAAKNLKEESVKIAEPASQPQPEERAPPPPPPPPAPPLPVAIVKPSDPLVVTTPSLDKSASAQLSSTQAQPSQDKPAEVSCPPTASDVIPPAPPLTVEKQVPGNFRKQSSLASKEPLSRPKSTPAPKEDANIPLVTPSLLQMVRLRSVNVASEQTLTGDIKPSDENGSGQEQSPSLSPNQTVPQKPIRKSLSLKSPPASAPLPSMRLQEAIRLKTAAMSSKDGKPARLSLRTSTSATASGELGVPSPRSPDEGALHKSPASTASFIFSKSTKKVVIETPSSPEAQTDLKKNLVAELMSVSSPTKPMTSPPPINGKPAAMKKPSKVPPPVAKKPPHVASNPAKPSSPTTKTESSLSEQHPSTPTEGGQKGTETHGEAGSVQPAGQQAQPKQDAESANGPETDNTVTSSAS
ncbi:NHS-like protein 3 isoform X2 [Amia ocellicauda]